MYKKESERLTVFRLTDWSTETWIDGHALEDGVPIAYFYTNRVASPTDHNLLDPEGNYLFVADFVVGGRHRGKGVGKAMYEQLEREARCRGIKMIWLQPQPRSEGFWKKMGFTYRSPKNGRPIEMEKQLISEG